MAGRSQLECWNSRLSILRSRATAEDGEDGRHSSLGLRRLNWNDGVMGSGKMWHWFTCREPRGRAIGKIPLNMKIDNVNR